MNEELGLIKKALDSAPPCMIADTQGKYVYVNDAWVAMSGVSRDDAIGKYVHDIYPETKIYEVLATGSPQLMGVSPLNEKTNAFVGNYTPLFENGTVVGVMLFTFFSDAGRILEFRERLNFLLKEIANLNAQLKSAHKYSLGSFIGETKSIRDLKEMVVSVSRSNSTVLIEGETGTGKEIIAHAIHDLSPRSRHSLVKLNCAAIPPELFESELFGYEEGAFTGSRRGGMKGKFELANQGSIFLDEVNQLSPSLQPKLLRVLQEKEIERVGGKGTIPIDARIISATNVPPEDLVKEKLMRLDLFYRLNVIRLKIPPLRERKDDLPLIAENIVSRLNRELGTSITGIDTEVIKLFLDYSWPGNVRELHNTIERAMNIAWIGQLKPEHFSEDYNNDFIANYDQLVRKDSISDKNIPTEDEDEFPESYNNSARILDEKKYSLLREDLIGVLHDCGGNRTKAAEKLGISRTALYKRIKKYHLEDI